MNIIRNVAASTLLVLGLAHAAHAEGEIVREIRYEGLNTLTPDTMGFYLGIQEGDTLDEAALNDRIHALWDRQLIDDVTVAKEELEDGVRLVISLVERPTLSEISYEGLKKVGKSTIADRMAFDRIEVREGEPLSRAELARLAGAIESLYAEKGFRLAEVDYRIEDVSSTEKRVVFEVDEGDKVRIAKIRFAGNEVHGDRRLRYVMRKTKETGLITRLFRRDIFKPAKFQEDLDRIRDLYRKAGYKDVYLGEPEIEVLGSGAARRRLLLEIPIDEGQRWRLGDITIEGNKRFSDELILQIFRRPQGGWLRQPVIDDGLEQLNDLYSNTGHLFADIKTELRERDDEVVDLIVRVEEGDQYRVRRIEFEGNVKTKDKVIRREMGIQEGLLLNTGALRNSLLRIRQLEFFAIDDADPVGFDIDSESKTVDLTIRGQEGERTELLFGGGFSEFDGFFGQFQFRTRNLAGRGETLALSLQSGSNQDVFDVSYSVPWFLDRPQNVGVQAFKRRLDFNPAVGQEFFQDIQGGTVTYGRNLGLFQNLSLSYSRSDIIDRQTAINPFDPTGPPLRQVIDRTLASLRLAYVFDKRDSRLQPTRGMRFATSLDYTGDFLGGTTSFVRPRMTFSVHRPVTTKGVRTVGGFNIELGHIEPLNNSRLFLNDRFFLGGENSLRGFRFNSISLRDQNGNLVFDELGFVVGGDTSLLLNLEYIFLTPGPFRFLVFGDLGNVFAEGESISIDRLRKTAGIELQVNVPALGAPLRFIYSFNLDPFANDRFEDFQFSVGPSF